MTVKSSRLAKLFRGRVLHVLWPPAMTVTGDQILSQYRQSLFSGETERMPLSKVATYRHLRGILWDTVIIESTGGTNDLQIDALPKSRAARLVQELEKALGTSSGQ